MTKADLVGTSRLSMNQLLLGCLAKIVSEKLVEQLPIMRVRSVAFLTILLSRFFSLHIDNR